MNLQSFKYTRIDFMHCILRMKERVPTDFVSNFWAEAI